MQPLEIFTLHVLNLRPRNTTVKMHHAHQIPMTEYPMIVEVIVITNKSSCHLVLVLPLTPAVLFPQCMGIG
jgi:hypothetical protein